MDYLALLNDRCKEKVVSEKEAVAQIRSGSRVFIGTGCGEPQRLIEAMVNDPAVQDIMIYQMLSFTLARFIDDKNFFNRFALKLFFISQGMRKAAFEGKIDYIPAYLSQISKLFSSRQISLDVALIQVSPPDQFGYCSLGVSVDITHAGVENASMVIAQVNPRMPRTQGDSIVHVDDINFLVLHEEPLVEALANKKNEEITSRIGYYVSRLVEDGATLQVGFGHLPNGILRYLDNKNDLGIHTQVITDDFLPLFEKRVITNKKKTLLPNRTVASLCMGSEKIYEYLRDNPSFYFRSSDFVNDPTVIARNDHLISISSALEVDLTGQVCTDSMGHLFLQRHWGPGRLYPGKRHVQGRIFHHRPAIHRPERQGLPHRAPVKQRRGRGHHPGGRELRGHRIRHRRAAGKGHLPAGHGAGPDRPSQIPGISYRRGQEEPLHLPGPVAAPGRGFDFSGRLQKFSGAEKRQKRRVQADSAFGRVFLSQLLLFPSEKKRFFTGISTRKNFFPERWCSSRSSKTVDYRTKMSLLGQIQSGGRKEIVAIGSYSGADNSDFAEVAFVVREDFQNMGITSYLLKGP